MGGNPEKVYDDEARGTFGFSTIFDSFFSSPRPMFSLSSRVWNPPADVYETAEEFVVKVEVAGIAGEDFDVSVHDNILIVRGCRRDCDHSRQVCHHNVEVRYGRFERGFEMPSGIDTSQIRADYDQGFLIVRIAKCAEPPRRFNVPVETD